MNKQKRELIFIVGVAKGDKREKRWILQTDLNLSFPHREIHSRFSGAVSAFQNAKHNPVSNAVCVVVASMKCCFIANVCCESFRFEHFEMSHIV